MRFGLLFAFAFAAPCLAESPKLPDGVTAESLADSKEALRVADLLDKQYPKPQAESVQMLLAILRGTISSGSDGWFRPAQTRYTWAWLTERCGVDAKSVSISEKAFNGPAAIFHALDRDGDNRLTPSDFDWSDANSYVVQANMLNRLFRRMESNGDGKLSKAEFDAVFQMVAKGKDHFTAADFRRAMIPRGPIGYSPGDAPSVPILVKGFFRGEIGSMTEGPKLGESAPDFTLKTADGKETVQLSKIVSAKPTVLLFGNFTCGPFRALYPDVDAIFERFKDRATFAMIYVREAHPTDGWKMESNTKMGVVTAQPTTYEQRVGVCEQFRKLIKPGMKILVDDIHDTVGDAYSGMPARLYVIDPQGKVVYKAGRGPFGFKPGEMEQALLMSILESTTTKTP